jgi:hypothetical protein
MRRMAGTRAPTNHQRPHGRPAKPSRQRQEHVGAGVEYPRQWHTGAACRYRHAVSSTNRGAVRRASDYYPTPAWCVRSLLSEVALPGGSWLEPCAGDGAIIRAVREVRPDVRWTGWELREEAAPSLRRLLPAPRLHIGDFLASPKPRRRYSVALTNPPFSRATPFVEACLERADLVVMLLRLSFLSTRDRADFMRSHCPDVYVLAKRPSFTGGPTDSADYAWFVWTTARRGTGRIRVLTPPRTLSAFEKRRLQGVSPSRKQ